MPCLRCYHICFRVSAWWWWLNVNRKCRFWHLIVKNCLTVERIKSSRGFLVDLSLENILWVTHFGSDSHKDRQRDKLVVETFRCREAEMNWARHSHCQGCGFDSRRDDSIIKKCSVGFFGGWKHAAAVELIWPNQILQVLQSRNAECYSTQPRTPRERVPVSVSR